MRVQFLLLVLVGTCFWTSATDQAFRGDTGVSLGTLLSDPSILERFSVDFVGLDKEIKQAKKKKKKKQEQ